MQSPSPYFTTTHSVAPSRYNERVNHNNLTYTQFIAAIAHAENRFAQIRQKYPRIKAYLVISLRGEQAEDLSHLDTILRHFPTLISGGPKTTELRRQLKIPIPKPEEYTVRAERLKIFQSYAEECTYLPEAQFELRFHYLDYDIIRELQKDELINQQLTPQTKASIRIVLGTVGEFVD